MKGNGSMHPKIRFAGKERDSTAKRSLARFAGTVCVTVLIGSTLLLGCRKDETSSQPLRVTTDDLGRSVEIPVRPTRVVSLAPSITEVVFAAGAADRLAAVTTADNYPPGVEEIHKLTAFPLDLEGLVALGPDLVLATDQINPVRELESLSELGIASYFLRFYTAEDVFEAIRKTGSLLGEPEAGERAADSLGAIWSEYMRRADTLAYKPTVLLLAGYDVLYAFGGDSYTNEIIAAAGGRSVTSQFEGQAATLSDEFVLTEQPEFIVGTFGDDFDVNLILERHPTWVDLPAFENDRVYSINADLISRPGPRIVDGARTIAGWIDAYRQSVSS